MLRDSLAFAAMSLATTGSSSGAVDGSRRMESEHRRIDADTKAQALDDLSCLFTRSLYVSIDSGNLASNSVTVLNL